jgi:2-keto-4-pentenoate hydratase
MINNIRELARRQLNDYQANSPGTCFSDHNFNLSVNEAYALQDAVTNLRIKEGERVIGYKVGCTGPGTIEQFGMEGPIRGTLFSSEALKNRARIDGSEFCNLAIEAEMALEVDSEGQISSVFPVIELHNFVFRGQKKSLPELIANNGINAGIVLPEIHWQKPLKNFSEKSCLSLYINDKAIGESGLWPTPGGPIYSLDWLKNNLVDYDLVLRSGHIVLSGTALGLFPVQFGDKIAVKVDDIIVVECFIKKYKET